MEKLIKQFIIIEGRLSEMIAAAEGFDDLLTIQARVKAFKDVFSLLLKDIDEEMQTIIEEEGDKEIEGKRYYISVSKKYKAFDKVDAVMAIVNHAGGEVESITPCLSSYCFNPGSCKTILGDDFDKYFAVEVIKDIKTGKPKRGLKVVDKKFLR